jgi:glycosyltransferase involved in cell wall biosynthesis
VPARGAVAILPIAICMAAGLPIVANVTYTVSELLEDRHTALMCGKRSPKALAQKVLEMRADSRLQWAMTDQAKTEAYEYFSVSRFLEEHRTLYGSMTRTPAAAV